MTAVKDCIRIKWRDSTALLSEIDWARRQLGDDVAAEIVIADINGRRPSDEIVDRVHNAFWLIANEAACLGLKPGKLHTRTHDWKHIDPRTQHIIEGQALAWCGIVEDDPAEPVSTDELDQFTRPEGVNVHIRFVKSKPGLPS